MIHLSATERAFIRAHLTTDGRNLLLRAQPAGIDLKTVAAQIIARQKAREKLPTWYANDELIFPLPLSVEQASSERTAQYKASLVQGDLLLDLTGGMGVDTWAFAQQMTRVVYVEQQPGLVALATHNLPELGATNVSFQTGNGVDLLDKPDFLRQAADWIFLDPHRRDDQGGKVVRLGDCEPDVTKPGMIDKLFGHTQHILLKASPLLDIDMAVRELSGRVKFVHVVAVQGEVKEVLFVLTNQHTAQETVQVNAVNLSKEATISFSFQWQQEIDAQIVLNDPQRYIYEPNAAVLKAGAFRLAATRFGLAKLAPHSHLYTSNELRSDFPGRIFLLQEVIKPDAKSLKRIIPDLKANLTVRNFPQTVAELRKKLSLREGGAVYILATTLRNSDKRLLITQKVDS
ncbi:SAM-dependent methyltransferase [Spirosoma harenae]